MTWPRLTTWRSSTSSLRRWASRSTSARRGSIQILEATERALRDNERNRLLGSASTVQPKLAAILACIYLPMFLLLILVPMFISTLGRL